MNLSLTNKQKREGGALGFADPKKASGVAKKEDDGWGNAWGEEEEKNIDYNTYNLNKLDDREVAREKQKMDTVFNKNSLKPGDQGFEYDKRIDFTKKTGAEADYEWDEEEDEEEEDYFEDDFL